ncbi:MAG TPA: SapB/AmfS family lanthipeptide [Pseudonocardiaceae bacterium]
MALLDLQALQVSAEYCDGHDFGRSRGRDCGSGLSLLLCG